jgi:Tol biopolymer transport system component
MAHHRGLRVGALCLVLAWLLSACGGGAGTTVPVAPSPAPTSTNTPPPASLVPAATATSPAGANLTIGPPIVSTISRETPLSQRRIAFTSCRRGTCQLSLVNADGSGQTTLLDNMLHQNPAFRQLAWSPDATRIAFIVRLEDTFPLYVLDLEQGRLTQISLLPVNEYPAWSPDGRYVLFSAVANDGEPLELFIADPDQGDPIQLTRSPSEAHIASIFAAWTPNPQEFLYFHESVHKMALQSGETGEVYRAPGSQTWSPSRDQVAYLDGIPGDTGPRSTNASLYRMRTDGTGRELLVYDPEHIPQLDRPTWSPDGAQIAFAGGPWEDRALYVIRPDGTGLQRFPELDGTGTGGGYSFPSWSPDGRYLAYLADGNIVLIDLETGQQQAIQNLWAEEFAWAPS